MWSISFLVNSWELEVYKCTAPLLERLRLLSCHISMKWGLRYSNSTFTARFFGEKRPTVTENIHWNYGSRSGAILKGVFLCILRPWVRNCAQNLRRSWIVVWDQLLIPSPDFKILSRLNMMHKYSKWKV